MQITLTLSQLKEAVQRFRYFKCMDYLEPLSDMTLFGVLLANRKENNRLEEIVLSIEGEYVFIKNPLVNEIESDADDYDYGYWMADSLPALYAEVCGGEAGAVEADGIIKVTGSPTATQLRLFEMFKYAFVARRNKFGDISS